MTSERKIAHAPRARDVALEVAALRGPCLGCPGCRGVCVTLIEALVIPDLVLRRVRS